MMNIRNIAMLAGVCVMAAACGPNLQNIGRTSDPTRFYSLTPVVEVATEEQALRAPNLVLGVGPVQVADYLDRSHIVVRESATRLHLAEFDRWAGNTQREIQRVLAVNLATLLGTEGVVTHPWKSGVSPEVSVEVFFDRFEKDKDGKVKLAANWQVYGSEGREPLLFRRTVLERESGAGYDDITAEMSVLVGELSREIAVVAARFAQTAQQR